MRVFHHQWRTAAITLLCVIAAFALAPSASAADPVKVTIALTGNAVPGATVTAKATVTISDGSTLQSIKWTQAGGLPVTLSATTGDTVSVTFPARKLYRERLLEVLEEPPLAAEDLPAHVPPPTAYEAGVQNRFTLVGASPRSTEEAGAAEFDLTVTTTSGTYHVPAEVVAHLPWAATPGLRNVPVGAPVLLQARQQATYNWTLTAPTGSTAALVDANTRNPEFTPDVQGQYKLAITDLEANKPVEIDVHAGRFVGVITGQDANGRPVADTNCTMCHVKTGPLDMFTPWAQSGHAEIFKDNVKTSDHYSESCLSCHTVGFDKNSNNGGIDDATGYPELIASGLVTHSGPLNWDKILTDYAPVARLANIQCENCHGPQVGTAHMRGDGSRVTLSSDACGVCHGEPARHGRYQQWQLSKHGNYELSREEGTDPTCGKCHSAQGYVQWSKGGFKTAGLNVDWTTEDVHPVTCATCHEPHNPGTTSGSALTNSTVRVVGSTPMLLSGFAANNVGTAATCMTCHNGRRGLRNDSNFNIADGARAPHVGPQTDVLMGENMYFVSTGKRGFHSMIQDSCVTCHMETTTPPPGLANRNADGSYGGTNHTFFADKTICSKCHTSITTDSVQAVVETKLEHLKAEIETALKYSMQGQIRLGNAIDLGGVKTVRGATDIAAVEFIESHGSQGVTVSLSDGSTVPDLSMTAVKVVRPGGTAVNLYSVSDPNIAKAGWNYFVVHSDKSKGVHNPAFVNAGLDVATFAVKQVNAAFNAPVSGVPSSAIGGGVGNYGGAVSCTTPYVYWAEIAGHMPGAAGSQWRTDLVARNLATSTASLKFVLHQANGEKLEGTRTLPGSSLKGFEDVVADLGGQNNFGSLEICSDQPLLVLGRIFNQGENGTFGQNIDGHVADLGFGAGQTVSLIGLRQKTNAFRTNISVTNAGATEAQVAITLFDANGTSLMTYNLTVPAGQVVQDGEPFRNRANQPDVDWGFATVTILKGTNIRTMGSVIDVNTNDPTTIPAKQ